MMLKNVFFVLPVLVAVLLYRASYLPKRQGEFALPAGHEVPTFGLDEAFHAAARKRLVRALKIKTVSYDAYTMSYPENFKELHAELERSFPLVHEHCEREVVSEYSLVFKWSSALPAAQKKAPIMLMSHMDVVPAIEGDESQWEYEPFAGMVIDSYIYGRGTMDDKMGVMGIMEGVELLIGQGVQINRDVFIVFGHDEEVGGNMGAREVAKLLAARGLRFAFVLDEGGLISEGVIPGIDGRAALIAVGEKGFTSLEMAVRSEGGHSSMPPLEGTPGGILAAGLAKLEQNQMPRRLDAFNIMTDFIGSEMPFINRLCIANQWLLGGLLGRVVGATPSGNAIVRTTTAITRMSGSEKDNVLPQEARATINFRLLSPDTPADVIAHVKATVNDDRIIVTEKPGYSVNASRTSATNNNEFKLIGRSIKQVVPDVLVSPMITVGGTDSKWMGLLSDNVYRFTPIYYEPRDLRRFHGINERISYEDYRRSITFYANLLTNAATKNWEE